MKSRSPLTIALILASLSLAWLSFYGPSDPTQSTPTPLHAAHSTERPEKLNLARPAAVIAPPPVAPALTPPLPPVSPTQGTDERRAPENSVPYTRVEGYVVAYGDILLGKPTHENFPQSGFIEAPKLKLWSSREVPFSIHESLPNPERVLRVIAYLNENSSVRFVPFTGQPDSLVFAPVRGLCLSYLGRVGGHQPIYLDDRCGDREIAHEIMHALGFVHEHSRPDRDNYLQVNWRNIEEDKIDQFTVVPPALAEPLRNRPFDYRSVMLYEATAFARDRSQPTLSSVNGTKIDPVSIGLSEEDLNRVQQLYAK